MTAIRLNALFNPRSIAVVGASEKSPWTAITRRCLDAYGFAGRVFAVNRTGAEVAGWPGFVSCTQIGQPVDVAHICVPAQNVAEALEDVGRAGIGAAVILTAGFAELGPAGALAQSKLAQRASELGIALLGPNCLGFANVTAQTAVTAIAPRGGDVLRGGCVALVAQSGATAAEVFEFARQQNVGLSFLAATGNEAQISIADVIDYLVDDSATRVIMVFAETIRHTDRFAAAAQRAFGARKPIIILKVGSSEAAARVAQAHTGALVGDDRVFDAARSKLNLIRVTSLEDLVVTAGLLAQTGPLPAGGLGVASISGGACTLIADTAAAVGLQIPQLAPATVEKLRTALPAYATAANPLDVTGAAVREPDVFERSLAALGEDPGIALRLAVLNIPQFADCNIPAPAVFAAIGRGLSAGSSPGLLVSQTLQPVNDIGRKVMEDHSIPGVIGGVEHAVRAAAQAIWWSTRLREESQSVCSGVAVRSVPLPRSRMSERAVLEYLAGFDIPVVPADLTHTPAEAVHSWEKLGSPIVLKIVSPDIAHKTEVGGVRLGLNSAGEIARAWLKMDASVRAAAPAARIEGISVSPMRSGGIELIVGTTRDPQWGMAIAAGLGGIWTEALNDTAVRLLPVSRGDALEMLNSLKAARILRGFRGSAAADIDRLADVIVRIGTAALALGPELDSLEINPLLVSGPRMEALDALVVWNAQSTAGG